MVILVNVAILSKIEPPSLPDNWTEEQHGDMSYFLGVGVCDLRICPFDGILSCRETPEASKK